MPETIDALYAFALAAVVAWILVPPSTAIARRIGAIDRPKERSLHRVPTPKLGGVAILGGVLASGLLGSVAFGWLNWNDETKGIFAGAAVIAAVGVVDDVFDLGAGWKLAGQLVAVLIPVTSGVKVGSFTFPFLGGLRPGSVDL